tara:strand:+ start:365 stop:754 length:390 start_codon:yes stop_codon:yes gene_type:complete
MRYEIKSEWTLPMCLEDFCIPTIIPISPDFLLKDIEINASDSPLSHLCSITVTFGSEVVYDGPIGKHGFVMQITELEPNGSYDLKFATNCDKLHSLVGEPLEPVRVVIRGYEKLDEEDGFDMAFTSEWS